jgi:hypothetical protein
MAGYKQSTQHGYLIIGEDSGFVKTAEKKTMGEQNHQAKAVMASWPAEYYQLLPTEEVLV